MLNKHAISWIGSTQEGFFSQMSLVPKRDGRQRPVINLKQLNQSVKTEHFKMEGIHVLRDLLKAGDWMAKIDLKDAYFMVPMAKEDRMYFCFQWKGRAYQFNCLPFGLSSVPWVFTKTTHPVVATLRDLGLRMTTYNNILIVAETESLLRNHIMGVVYLLENLGVVLNYPKSQLTPFQEIEFLKFVVNSTSMEPEEKKDQKRDRQNLTVSNSDSPDAVLANRENECSHSGHSHGSPVLRKPPRLPPRGTPGGSGLFHTCDHNRGGQRRTGMV